MSDVWRSIFNVLTSYLHNFIDFNENPTLYFIYTTLLKVTYAYMYGCVHVHFGGAKRLNVILSNGIIYLLNIPSQTNVRVLCPHHCYLGKLPQIVINLFDFVPFCH